jgi:hypothetical protein
MPVENLRNRTAHSRSAIHPPDTALHRVLERLVAGEDVAGTPEWEAVGAHLLVLAERDAQDWRLHANEYVGAYVMEVIAMFRRRARTVVRAPSPWGLAVSKGRLAGRYAVGLEALGGLTGRDAVNHRIRLADVPRVVSLESLVELGGEP